MNYRFILSIFALAACYQLQAMEAEPVVVAAQPKPKQYNFWRPMEPCADKAELESMLRGVKTAQEFMDVMEEVYDMRCLWPLCIAQARVTKDELTLILAASHNHLPTIDLLISQKVDVSAANYLALNLAAGRGHTEAVKRILAAGGRFTNEAMCAALVNDHIHIAALLVLSMDKQAFDVFYKDLFKNPCGQNWRLRSQIIAEYMRNALVDALYDAEAAKDLEAYKKAATQFYEHRCLFNSCTSPYFEAESQIADMDTFALFLASIYDHREIHRLYNQKGVKNDLADLDMHMAMEKIRGLIRKVSITGPLLQESIHHEPNRQAIRKCLRVLFTHDPRIDQKILMTALVMAIMYDRVDLVRIFTGHEAEVRVNDLRSIDGFYGQYENCDSTKLVRCENLGKFKSLGGRPYECALRNTGKNHGYILFWIELNGRYDQ